ncbi:FimV/HubP family polar landmark protein [Pseudomonas sp. EYE_354]|uniref:FimV/HubP family polar landmark protein n=1 Tax=Pseudomonas sp. EYE_354 TaxID=2853449 RepID=UPI0020055850|nr:FimV/HubP family polar landmark protein [Pseudomonas sp. EYE_354]MCK6189866.1 LysM peptidoglycan-binding domain-containing protein [Pseudomonas sp. EYE_354]
MVQVRKLVLAIAAASALSSGMAQALQLGEMTLKSKLNQPLSVEIELLDVGGLTASEITPSLASSQAFVDAGVDRQAFLNDLTFTPVINPSGRSVVRVTSSKPLPDSYVRFLLQVQWPNGRLMRDYSVLLDPAKFDPSAPAATAPAPRLSAPASATPAVSKPAQHTTSSRDTLWEIAEKYRNGGSVQQTMLAIQALNPGAFIDGNINRLKTGQVLRLPDTVQSTALPQPRAIAEVRAQNEAWRQGRRAANNPAAGKQQLDATKRAQAGNAPSTTNAQDNLSLVSAEAARKGGKGKAGDSQVLSDKLAMTQEQLDTTRRDNEELKSRAADLQSQLDKLQKLIQLKNDQLARLQAEKADPAAQATTAMPAQLASDPAATPATPAAPVATPTPAAPAAEPVTPVAAADTTQGKFDELLTNPVVLGVIGGAAGLLVLLLLLLWARHRNARREEEKHLRMARALAEEPLFSSDIQQDLPPDSFEGLEVSPPSVKLAAAPAPAPTPVVEPAVAAPTVASVLAPLAVAVAPQNANDALAQAQSHIDRGHLNQAADVLEQAIKHEPKRSDLRLKLMEVYGLQSDKDGFVTQERQLVANGENHAQVEQLKSRFPAMAVVAAGVSAAVAAAALDAQYVKELLEDKPVAPAPEPDALDTDFDLSLDELEAASPANLDDELSFESVLAQQTEAKASPDDLSDFDLDLQLDAPASAQSDDDFLSGLEEEMKDVPAVEPPTLTPAALDDFDLPEDFDLSLADEPDAAATPDAFASELDDVNAELDRLSQSLEHPPIEPTFTAEDAALGDDEPEFDFLSGTNEVSTKLDLAQAYIDMGDADGAKDILAEVLTEGDESQRGEAKEMLSRLA